MLNFGWLVCTVDSKRVQVLFLNLHFTEDFLENKKKVSDLMERAMSSLVENQYCCLLIYNFTILSKEKMHMHK